MAANIPVVKVEQVRKLWAIHEFMREINYPTLAAAEVAATNIVEARMPKRRRKELGLRAGYRAFLVPHFSFGVLGGWLVAEWRMPTSDEPEKEPSLELYVCERQSQYTSLRGFWYWRAERIWTSDGKALDRAIREFEECAEENAGWLRDVYDRRNNPDEDEVDY